MSNLKYLLSEAPNHEAEVHFEGLVYLLIYIRDNKILGLKYYAKMEDAPIFELLRHARIKNENQLMVFYDSS